jgi:hypothetical protein
MANPAFFLFLQKFLIFSHEMAWANPCFFEIVCYNRNTILMEVLPWLIRSLLLASAAALALMLAPSVLSALVTISTSSTPVPAWTAVLAATPAPTAPSFPRTNSFGIHKTLQAWLAGFFVFHYNGS